MWSCACVYLPAVNQFVELGRQKATARGCIYFGDRKKSDVAGVDGERRGWGVMKYPDGSVYSGQWSNGYRKGVGQLVYPPNPLTGASRVYEGQFGETSPARGIAELAESDYIPMNPPFGFGMEWNEKGELERCGKFKRNNECEPSNVPRDALPFYVYKNGTRIHNIKTREFGAVLPSALSQAHRS